MKRDVSGRWAVITGASSGLGVDFARELAARGMHIVLVARRETRLREVSRELTARYGVKTKVIALDLAKKESAAELHARTRELEVDVLINNAGFGLYGYELELDWTREREMLELDMLTLTELARLFAGDMAARKRGHILNVASLAGTQPSPTFAAYAAAKSYVIHYSVALREELKAHGVHCTVLAPGATATEFFEVSGAEETLYIRLVKMTSPEVTRLGVAALLRNHGLVVPGLINKLSLWSMSLLPRGWVARIVHFVMKRRTPALLGGGPPSGV